MSNVEQLNATYGKKDAIHFVAGGGGLVKAVLTSSANHSSAEVYLYAAQVTSWKARGAEHIFLADKSFFEVGKPIRGGIPLCWPQFGPGALPQHGFARTSLWEVISTAHDGDSVSVSLQLTDSEATHKIWDHKFKAVYTVKLNAKLETSLTVRNLGDAKLSHAPFSFQLALHTYFAISDIKNISITGLKGVTYIDKTRNFLKQTEDRQAVTISQETDRIYVGPKGDIVLQDTAGASIRLDRHEFPDAVVWNPWEEKAKAVADLGENTYSKFVCVELGRVEPPFELAAGQEWTGSQTFELLSAASSL